MRVVLIGFMGAGKTSVGRALARRLRWKFRDLDDVVIEREKQSVAEIFAGRGEAAFRRAESAALQDLLQESPDAGDLVLALGGGAFVQARNRKLLKQADAVTVLLHAPLKELRRRCQSQRTIRPLAKESAKFAALFAARRADYERARFRVRTMNKSVKQVAAEVARLVKAVGKLEVEK